MASEELRRLVVLEAKNVGVKKATKEWEDLSDGVKQAILEEEEFKDSQEEVNRAFNQALGPVGRLKSSLQGFRKTLSASIKTLGKFRVALIATGIGALLIALTSLGALLKTNQGAINFVNDALKVLGATVNVLINRFAKLGSALVKVFTGDFRGAINDTKEAFTGLGDAISEAVNETLRLEAAQRDLEDQLRINRLGNAQDRADLKELVLLSRDRTLSAIERQRAILQAQRLQDDVNQRNIAAAEREQQILKDQIAIRTQGRALLDDEKDELIAAELEVQAAREQAADRNRDLVNRQFELQLAVDKEREKARESERLYNSEVENNLEIQNAAIDRQIEGFIKIDETLRDNTENRKKAGEVNKKILEDEIALVNAQAQVYSDFFGGLAALAGQNSVFGKSAAIAQATIDTYAAANSALKQPALFPGQRFIAAAAVIAAGLANVKTILGTPIPKVQAVETSFARGGVVDGPSHAQGGVRYMGGRVELEGGEGVINKRSMRVPWIRTLASELNSYGNFGTKFQAGGVIPRVATSPDTINLQQQTEEIARAVREQQVVAIVEDITSLQTEVNIREDRANLG